MGTDRRERTERCAPEGSSGVHLNHKDEGEAMSENGQHEEDVKVWSGIADPLLDARTADEDAERAREAATIFESWGFESPVPSRRWPTDGDPPPGSFEARQRDIDETVRLQAEVQQLMKRRGGR